MIDKIDSFLPFIPALTSIALIFVGIIKIINRTRIEVLLQKRHQRNLHDILRIVIVSLVLSSNITIVSLNNYEIPFSVVVVSTLVVMVGSVVVALLVLLALIVNTNTIKKYIQNIKLKFFSGKSSFKLILCIILFVYILSLIMVNLGVQNLSQKYNDRILTTLLFSVTYFLVLLSLITIISNISPSNREHFEMSIIEDVNACLVDLSYLYAIDDQKLAFIRKKDIDRDVNSITEFYIYYSDKNRLVKFNVHNK